MKPPPLPAALVTVCVAAAAAAAASCGDGRREDTRAPAGAQTAGAPVPPPPGAAAAGGDPRVLPAAELEAAGRDVVAFLRGAAPFDSVELADSVVLYVSPEGGGARATLRRDQLRRPSSWVVRSGRQRYAFVPPPRYEKLTTRVGRHFNCVEYPLSSRFPELAPLPHVGVKLEPDSAGSCLQSWNVTLVFAPDARPPRLVAAVYDQWEW